MKKSERKTKRRIRKNILIKIKTRKDVKEGGHEEQGRKTRGQVKSPQGVIHVARRGRGAGGTSRG